MNYHELHEKKIRGSANFPIELYHVDKNHPAYEMILHWHREFEFVRVISGELKLYLNGDEYIMKNGDTAMVGCGVLHRATPKKCVYDCIVMKLDMLRHHNSDVITNVLAPILNGELVPYKILNSKDNEIHSAVWQLFDALDEHDIYSELTVYSTLYKIYALLYKKGLLRQNDKNKRTGHQSEIIAKLLDWIDDNFGEPITLSKMAAVCGLNEKYLCRLFKLYTTRTPMDYVNYIRVEAAAYEIMINHISITDAAFACGFNDLSHFSKTFKKYKGASPNKYVKK